MRYGTAFARHWSPLSATLRQMMCTCAAKSDVQTLVRCLQFLTQAFNATEIEYCRSISRKSESPSMRREETQDTLQGLDLDRSYRCTDKWRISSTTFCSPRIVLVFSTTMFIEAKYRSPWSNIFARMHAENVDWRGCSVEGLCLKRNRPMTPHRQEDR